MPAIPWVIGGMIGIGSLIWGYNELGESVNDSIDEVDNVWEKVDFRAGLILGMLGYYFFGKRKKRKRY